MDDAVLKAIRECVIDGEDEVIIDKVEQALQKGINPKVIIDEALRPAISLIGRRFRDGELYVPDMIMGAEAMKAALEVMKPQLSQAQRSLDKRIVIATVENDLHDLGKIIVSSNLLANGFEVVDLGVDVSKEKIIESIYRDKPDILALSCTLSYTLVDMKRIVTGIRELCNEKKIKIIVGGLSINQRFANEIGADAYAIDEEHIALLAMQMVKGMK